MKQYKDFVIDRNPALSSMWEIKNENGGNISNDLKGLWSSLAIAQSNIDAYLIRKEQKAEAKKEERKKKTDAKTKSPDKTVQQVSDGETPDGVLPE